MAGDPPTSVESVPSEERFWIEMYGNAVIRWRRHCFALLDLIAAGESQRAVIECIAEWLDEADATDDECWAKVNAALDALAPEPDG